MTKKILAMVLAVLMVVAMLPTSVFAEAPTCAGHGNDHCTPLYTRSEITALPEVNSSDYQLLGIYEATCEEPGGLKALCNVCGDTFFMVIKEQVSEEKHSWIAVDAISVTCLDDGQKAYSYCDVCGDVKYTVGRTEEPIKKGMELVKGEWQLTGAAKETLKVPTNGAHNFINPDPEKVNCATGGTYTQVCKDCGAEGEEITLVKGQHTAGDISYNGKQTTVKCEECGLTLEVIEDSADYKCDHEVNKKGFPSGKTIVHVNAVPSSHTETGVLEHYYCASCGKYWICDTEYYYEWTDKLPVTDKNGDPVMDEVGYEYKTRPVVAADTIIAEVNHVYDNAKAELTCESTCLRCDICGVAADEATFKAALAEKLMGHDFDADVWGCDAADTQKCNICKKEFTAAQVGGENDEHDYDDHPLNGYVQCTDEYRYCLSCKKDIKQDPALLGAHNFGENQCLNEGAKCSYCNKTSKELGIYTDGEHKMKIHEITTKADCVSNARATMKCSVCGNMEYDVEQKGTKLGHDMKTLEIPGTCCTEAYTFSYCENENCPTYSAYELNKNNGLSYAVIKEGDQIGLSYTKNGDTYYLWVSDDEYGISFAFESYQPRGWKKALLTVAKDDDGNFILKYGTAVLVTGNNKLMIPVDDESEFVFFTNGANKLYDVNGNALYVNNQKLSTNATAGYPELELYIVRNVNTAETVRGNIDSTNHAYLHEGVKTEADCINNEWVGKYCEGCGNWYDVVEKEGTALGHDYTYIVGENEVEDIVTQLPTCSADGSITYTCHRDGCGRVVVDRLTLEDYQKANPEYTGHEYSYPEASHENQLLTGSVACDLCGQAEKSYTITWDKIGKEDWDFETANKAHGDGLEAFRTETGSATCTTNGVVTKKCAECEKMVTWTVKALGHDLKTKAYEDGHETTYLAPTCSIEGYDYTWECTRVGCGANHIVKDEDGRIVSFIVLKTVAHEYVETDAFKKAVKSLKEGEVLSYEGHENLVWMECKYGCGCNIKAFEHVKTVNSSYLCTASNYEAYLTYYGKVLVYNRVGNFGHMYFYNREGELPTHNTIGYHTEKCYWCGSSTDVVDEKLPHMNDEGRYFTDSCQDTETNRYCEICDANIEKNHNWKTEIVKATCTTASYVQLVCCNEGCTAIKDRIDAGNAKGHSKFEKPTANWEGDQNWSYVCTRCKETISGVVPQKTGIHLVTDATEYTYGSLITVTVRMDNVKASLAGYQFTMRFDSDKLALVGFENIDNHNFVSAIDLKAANTAGVVNITGTHAEKGNYTFDGSDVELLTLYFRVKNNVKDAGTISYDNAVFTDAAGKDVKNVSNVTSDATTFALRKLGDFNGIVGLTIHDVTAALEMITYGTTKTYDVAMDVNFDGTFDGEDVRILMELLSVSDGNDRAAAMKALVCEAMGEEHAELCFGLEHCTDCKKAYYDSTYCPSCGKALN